MLPQLLILLTGLAAVAAGDAATVSIRAEGSAPGVGPVAREEATANARLAAVIECVERIAPDVDLAVLMPLLRPAPAYISSARRIKLDTHGRATVVELEARVLKDELRRDVAAALLPRVAPNAQVLLLVAERLGNQDALRLAPGGGVAESALARLMRQSGLTLVETAGVFDRYSEGELMDRLRGDVDSGAKLGRETMAGVVVLGVATAQMQGPDGDGLNLGANRARLDLRVLSAEDDAFVETFETESSLYSRHDEDGSAQALDDACEKVAPQLLTAVALAAARRPAQPVVVLTIEGIAAEAELEEILRVLLEHTDIDSMEELFRRAEAVRYRLHYGGAVAPLVKEICEANYPGFRLQAVRVVDREMTFSVCRRAARGASDLRTRR